MVDVRPPAGRFGRKTAESAHSGYHLQERHLVHGFFKWQHHGPQASLRKLIWVDDFERGPKDAPRVPTPLYKL